MVAPHQRIRLSTLAGSGNGEPNPAANSRAEDRAERSTPGAATGEVLVMPLEGGGEVRFTAGHGRVDMQIRVGKQRSWLTTAISVERALSCSALLGDIGLTALAQRQAKGA